MPGSPGQVSAQDHMGDGSLLLVLPHEDGLHVSPKVCVWAQEGIKEQGHRAFASAFEAFKQVAQVLVQDGDPWHLSELPVQQGVWVDGVWLHIGGVARQQVGQADAGGTIADDDDLERL